METPEQLREKLKNECCEQSWQTYGYGYIFDKRADRYSRYVNLLKVFGIGIPGVVGFCFLAHEYFLSVFDTLRYAAILILVIQFIFSILAVIYKWDDELAYSYEASQAYSYLYDRFRNLAKISPDDYAEFNNKYELLLKELVIRGQQDSKHNLKEWELRMGMRYTLREHKRPCAASDAGQCSKQPPLSMDSTDCPVCGRFSLKYKLFNL